MPPASPITEDDADLRADIRRLGTLLGRSLVRQVGPELLDRVEEVRKLSRTDPAAAAALLQTVDPVEAGHLVRAFNAFFHLANVTEQVHRGRALRTERARDGGALAQVARRIEEHPEADPDLELVADGLAVRPVFTAHPTEAARRSILTKLRAVADLLEAEAANAAITGVAATAETDRRLAPIIDLLWLTDELRRSRPDPLDEARNAVFHLVDLQAGALPEVLDDVSRTFAELGVHLPDRHRPLSFGSWIGGDRDGNPNVTPELTTRVLELQHAFGIEAAEAMVDALIESLGVSAAVAGVSAELEAHLEANLERLPEVPEHFRRLNVEEPYRLELSCIRAKLARTRTRLEQEAPHRPGLDYLGSAELVADLDRLRRSLAAHGGELAAGELARAVRVAATTGLHLATLDLREHAAAHHSAIAALYRAVGEPYRPYEQLSRAERTTLLARELGGHRPLAGRGEVLEGEDARTFGVFTTVAAALDRFGPEVAESYIVSSTPWVIDTM